MIREPFRHAANEADFVDRNRYIFMDAIETDVRAGREESQQDIDFHRR